MIFDTLEGVYDNITLAVASVTDKPIIAAVYPHYHADHIGVETSEKGHLS